MLFKHTFLQFVFRLIACQMELNRLEVVLKLSNSCESIVIPLVFNFVEYLMVRSSRPFFIQRELWWQLTYPLVEQGLAEEVAGNQSKHNRGSASFGESLCHFQHQKFELRGEFGIIHQSKVVKDHLEGAKLNGLVKGTAQFFRDLVH